MKLTRLTKITFLLAFFFLLDKILAFLRQILIARQFGLSVELDAFNVANNVPDLLFALISGGALAIAFIPVLSEVLTRNALPGCSSAGLPTWLCWSLSRLLFWWLFLPFHSSKRNLALLQVSMPGSNNWSFG